MKTGQAKFPFSKTSKGLYPVKPLRRDRLRDETYCIRRLTTSILMILDFYPVINFGRYCNASARCADRISSLPAKSAIVRVSIRIRWYHVLTNSFDSSPPASNANLHLVAYKITVSHRHPYQMIWYLKSVFVEDPAQLGQARILSLDSLTRSALNFP